jgi:hypothetical protein
LILFSFVNTLGYNHYEKHDSLPGGGCIALRLRWRSSEAATICTGTALIGGQENIVQIYGVRKQSNQTQYRAGYPLTGHGLAQTRSVVPPAINSNIFE